MSAPPGVGPRSVRFTPGMFTPDPAAAGAGPMLLSQSRFELRLLLRNGEQLLLTMFIPLTLLIGLTLLPVIDLPRPRVSTVVPGIMALAVMSTAFTGQAIAVGFDRRYGALKRLGATALPRWGVLAGKTAAVGVVVALQALLIGGVGGALGWRPSVGGLALGAVILGIGTAAFGALGLLLGGSLKAEVVLALANAIWLVLLGLGGVVVPLARLPAGVAAVARLLPSGALSEALRAALAGGVDPAAIGVLLGWGVLAAAVATRTFRFT